MVNKHISAKKKSSVLINIVPIMRPNTGLFYFSKELASAIESVKDEYNIETTYYVKKESKGIIANVNYRIAHFLDKVLFILGLGVDLFHASYQLPKCMPFAAPSVLTIHDLNFLYEHNDDPEKVQKILKKHQARVDKAKHIVAISEFVKSDIEKYLNIGEKPVDVIYNGCNFYVGEKLDNPRYNPSLNFIFTIGTVLRKKNFHTLPTLLVGNDYELVIAGKESPYADEIMAEAKMFGVEDRVKIIGEITDAERDWYYRHCTAFVFPSIAEGFGLPLIEAMSYGKPTFISTHTSLPEIGQNYSFYFNSDFDREKMREEFAAGLKEFQSRDVEAQIKYAKSYSWERAARSYCEIYLKVLGR